MPTGEPSKAGLRFSVVPALLVLSLIGAEGYVLLTGPLLQFLGESPSVLIFLSMVNALYAAWNIIEMEYLPERGPVRLTRKTRIWFNVGINVGGAGLLALWLEPRFATPIVVAIFLIADLMSFQAAREILDRRFVSH